jgi:hypothetical protein
MSDTIEEAIQLAIWGEIEGKMHTAIPGIVSKYDPSKPSVEVQPAVKKIYYNGTELSFPVIVSVPIIFPRTKKFHLSFPIEKGDGVLIIFSERSIEEFLQNGVESTPTNSRIFALTDAIAIPGLFGFGKGSKIIDGTKMELIFDNTKIVSDGISFEFTGDVKINGNLEVTDDTEVGSVSLKNHTHGPGSLVLSLYPAVPPTGVTGSPT